MHGYADRFLFFVCAKLCDARCGPKKDGLKPLTDTHWKRVKYYVPGLDWIPNYSLSLYVFYSVLFLSRVSSPFLCVSVPLECAPWRFVLSNVRTILRAALVVE
jgi:hypothetical protein